LAAVRVATSLGAAARRRKVREILLAHGADPAKVDAHHRLIVEVTASSGIPDSRRSEKA
jgi:hypothetical protein